MIIGPFRTTGHGTKDHETAIEPLTRLGRPAAFSIIGGSDLGLHSDTPPGGTVMRVDMSLFLPGGGTAVYHRGVFVTRSQCLGKGHDPANAHMTSRSKL